jgi:hypothetical protein
LFAIEHRDKTVETKRIETLLDRALLKKGKMERALYEFELEEHLDAWYEELKLDGNTFTFAITENSGDVAMVLITTDKTVYINEEARDKLSEWWGEFYSKNIKSQIPSMAEQLANDTIPIYGVTIADEVSLERTQEPGFTWWI